MHTVSTQLAACIHDNFGFNELKHFTKIILLFSFFFSDRLQTFTMATGHGDTERERDSVGESLATFDITAI